MTEAGEEKFSRMPRWKAILIAAGGLLTSLGGVSGIVTLVEALQDPDIPPVACDTYWNEIGELKEDGFTGFELLVDDNLEERCGDATEVARSWE